MSEAVSPAVLLELHRRHSSRGLGGDAGDWLAWFLADCARREAAPGADWTVEQVRVREEAEANRGWVSGARVVEQLLALEPTNGWLTAQAARVGLEEYVRRQDSRVLQETGWLSRRAVELAPGHAAVWWTYANQAAIEGLEGNAKLERDELRLAWLACARIHAQTGNREAARIAHRQAYELDIPPRDPQGPARLIDLSDYYTAGLDADWQGSRYARHALSGLPRGRQTFAGVEYDVRGLVQLSSELLELRRLHFPRTVVGIPVGQRCARLHFLHAADAAAGEGETVARYTIYLDNGTNETIAIRYAEEAWPWDWEPLCDRAQAAAVWRGSSPAGSPVWLYRTTWTNAQSEVPVVAVDLSSTMTRCGMFMPG
jgi:hypothetical protein